ncbi:acyltransferase [[Clostridium] innocuum]|nr:acyltransferase [[Clostridium] innocuum]MCR0527253.1 acyltransferase [[Clostridium] innocuum]MCR0625933.1 acyltransferase [[Clostridium] innocuum]
MINFIRKIRTFFFTTISIHKIKKHGNNLFVNHYCRFNGNTVIGSNCHFNGMRITGTGKVTFGDNFHSGSGVWIITSYHNYDQGSLIPYDDTYINKDVIINDNVWLGQNVTILGGVTIGEGAIIQAGSVVVSNIPKCSIAGGHPAKVFKKRNEYHYYKLKDENKFF